MLKAFDNKGNVIEIQGFPSESTLAAGDLLYWDGTAFVKLAAGTNGQTLKMNAGATAPEWVS